MNALRAALAAFATAALVIAAPAPAVNAQQPSPDSETITSPAKDQAGVQCKPGSRYEGKETELCIQKRQVSPQVIQKKFAEALKKPRVAARAAEAVNPPRSCPVTVGNSVQHISRLSECSAISWTAIVREKPSQKILGTQRIYDWQWIDFQ
jgi:hypothetical protein